MITLIDLRRRAPAVRGAASRAAPAAASASPADWSRWAMLAGAWLVYFCFGLTTTAMAPLLHAIAAELGVRHATMGAVLGAWPLVYIVSAVPCGMAVDRLGLRVSLAIGAAIIALSAALRALATDPLGLGLAVGIFGLGGPLVSVGVPKLISVWFDRTDRGLAMGLCVTAPAVGGVAALALTNSVMMPLLAGRWRAVLVAYALVALGATAVWLVVSARAPHRSLEPGAGDRHRSPLAAFAALAGARPVQIVLAMSVGIFFFNHGLNNWLPEVLRTGGMDAAAAGYWASIPTAVGVAGALVVPRLAVPARRPAILAGLLTCAVSATFLIDGTAGPLLAVGLLLQGLARGSLMATVMLVLMDMRAVGARNVGAAGGLFFSAAEIGGVLGPLTIGVLYDWTGGFGAAMHVLAAVCLAVMLLLRALGRAEAAAQRAALRDDR